MPLTRATITNSSRVMLVVYPVFFLAIAAGYILGDPARTSSPSFDYVRGIMAIHYWGFLFLGVGLLELAAWVVHRRQVMVLALCLGFGVSLAWTSGFAASLFDKFALNWSFPFVHISLTPDVSLNAPWLWGFIALAHIASLQSLTKDSA